MDVSMIGCDLPQAPANPPLSPSEHSPARIDFDTSLSCRLAQAKARLDRLEHDLRCRDYSALAMAQVEFALAARALADALIAQGLHIYWDAN